MRIVQNMIKHNGENERIKRNYLAYLKAAKGYDEATLDMHAKAIARFEDFNRRRSFKKFHIEQAKAFRDNLGEAINPRTGRPLARTTVHQTLNALRSFFLWLAGQAGYKSRISYADADYFSPNRKDARAVASRTGRAVPTLEQIEHVIACMPGASEIEQRDRALLAFAILTGARDRAIASMRMKHIDVGQRRVLQDGREVETKGSKTIETWFFPVAEEIEAIVLDWVKFLRSEKLFGEDDPLFPATEITIGADRRFAAQGLSRRFWSTADPVRQIFKAAFARAGLPYYNPHSFRNTLVQLGERVCRTPEEFKAWSQNLGHEQVSTTFTSYGKVPSHRQGELIRKLGHAPVSLSSEQLEAVAKIVADAQHGPVRDQQFRPNANGTRRALD